FSGSGAAVKWRAPQSGTTPFSTTIALTVVERYTSVDAAGLPIASENRATKTTSVSVHDSINEVGDMARQFLEDFSRQLRPAEQVVRAFTSCPRKPDGRDSELSDVRNNQDNFSITQWSVDRPRVTINFGGVCGFRSRPGDACANV